MNKTKKLLSFRYSKTNPFRKIWKTDLKKNRPLFKTYSNEACPLCSRTNVKLISELDRYGVFCDTVICCYCNFVFNDTLIIDPIEYYRDYYGKIMWKKDEEANFLSRTSPNAFCWKRFAYVALNMGNDFHKIKNVLEIGCADGCNLYPYHVNGKMVEGYDYGKEYLDVGKNRGMKLVQGDFSKCEKKFDLILLIHTFHQLFELDDVVRNVNRLLKDNGRVYVEVPGIRNWNREQKMSLKEDGFASSNNFLLYLQYQHNFHFDLSHMTAFWQRNGFELIKGDEWVRALFKKGEVQESIGLDYDIFSHLKLVEKNYLSPKILMGKISVKFLK